MTTSAGMRRADAQEMRMLNGSAAGPVDGGNNAIDPQIQKLNDINSKYEAKIAADKAAVQAVQSQIDSAQDNMSLIAPLTKLGALDAQLAADEAAHMAEINAWNNFVGMKWPGGKVNAFNANSTKGVQSGFKGAHGMHGKTGHGGHGKWGNNQRPNHDGSRNPRHNGGDQAPGGGKGSK
jgi:hypothetical protein